MHKYQNEYLLLRQNLWKYRKDDIVKKGNVSQIMRNQHGIKISEKSIRREKEPEISAFEQEVADLKIRHFKIAKGTPDQKCYGIPLSKSA